MTELPKGTVRLNINIDETLHTAFKAAAALERKRMTDLIVDFIERFVREHSVAKTPRKGKAK